MTHFISIIRHQTEMDRAIDNHCPTNQQITEQFMSAGSCPLIDQEWTTPVGEYLASNASFQSVSCLA